MDRKKFQNMFVEIDEFLIGAICDDIELCEEIEYPVYSKYFYPPQVCKKLSQIEYREYNFSLCGISEGCEKNMIAVKPKDFPQEELYFPVKYFKITNRSKFKELEHKHYLGTIMSFGIKRELMGDLIVEDDSCYGIVSEEIFDFLVDNLKEVGRNPVTVEEVDRNQVPSLKFEELVDSVSSVRLDNIVSVMINNSRSKGLELIETGEVSVNYVVDKEKNSPLKEGDIVTIRKKGKFIFEKILGENKKGKIRVLIKRFI
ncbi:RNA-binding protein [Fusobacterium mortiferum]|uniref:RNA-binding protein n=1 Tax=Fusobacterium mortiferum TaxID=850 RepID=A0A414PNE8_FUSMR|nr:YlmH/Sll1252 family protein [Fusobacterium mortiferum]RHF70130.1 RNA-binding protein [Fusobacterium mortiferum]